MFLKEHYLFLNIKFCSMLKIRLDFLIILLGIILVSVFLLGLYKYDESKLIYTFFSIIFFLLLLSGFYKTITYSYLFLSIFLFLGFWFKLTIHLILDYPYVEPIGLFYSSNSSMDDVLIVSMVGAIAILIVYFLFNFFRLNKTTKILENKKLFQKDKIYYFYKKYKTIILSCLFFIIILLAVLNVTLNIQMTGVVPTTILVFPFNALIYWLLAIGVVLIFSYFVHLEILYEKVLKQHMVFLFLLLSAISSISILSRGTFIFLFGGFLFFILFNFESLNKSRFIDLIKLIITAILFYFMVIYIVTILRDIYFHQISIYEILNQSGVSGVLLGLAADRWVGLEGVMAVVSYPFKSFDLFIDAFISNPKIGSIDIYQYISNAHYVDMDNTKYAFATIPGSIAFFFYSGSHILVFVGIFCLVSLMIVIEKIVFYMSQSTLFVALIGVSLASNVVQFGLAPINLVKSLVILFCFLVCVKFVEYYFNRNYK